MLRVAMSYDGRVPDTGATVESFVGGVGGWYGHNECAANSSVRRGGAADDAMMCVASCDDDAFCVCGVVLFCGVAPLVYVYEQMWRVSAVRFRMFDGPSSRLVSSYYICFSRLL